MNPKPPVLLLAFANDKTNESRFLRGLEKEMKGIKSVLDPAATAGLCEYEIIEDATINKVVERFQDPRFRDRIAIFHFAGHAGGYHLALESKEGETELAHASGFAEFLGNQRGLEIVFLNGCSTQKQTDALIQANVSAVISTSQSIDDTAATQFSTTFYQSLCSGDSLDLCFREASSVVKIRKGSSFRDLYWDGMDKTPDVFPWNLYIRPGAEIIKNWNLPEASRNPLFGLPDPPQRELPEMPYRFLKWYRPEDADIFFGRDYQIRELFDTVTGLVHPEVADTGNELVKPFVVHFYGASGVGKSSLLAAGLFPRLEADFEVRYIRREPALGLSGSMSEGIGAENSHPEEILKKWKEIERQKPLILILDQAEEVYTRPKPELAEEWPELIRIIQQLVAAKGLRGKLILGYRKEYLAEIESQFKLAKIACAKVFLENLKKPDIMQAVLGLTQKPRLKDKYGLTVEDGLANTIANDILEDKEGAIAPVLQILLSNMWVEATKANKDHPEFSRSLYLDIKKAGIWMGDFLDSRLDHVRRWNAGLVDSGLVLDLLGFHITNKGTATSRSLAEILPHYSHVKGTVPALLEELKKHYLLIDPDMGEREGDQARTRLAHDTLATLVNRRIAVSNAPGPQALRSLRSRLSLNTDPAALQVLDPDDLNLVEAGRKGMRHFNRQEQHLVLCSQSFREAADNPSVAFALAVEACQLDDGQLSRQALLNAAHAGQWYEDFMPDELSIRKAFISPDGKKVVVFLSNLRAEIRDRKGNLICELADRHDGQIGRFSHDGNLLATADTAGLIRIWNEKGERLDLFGEIFAEEGVSGYSRMSRKMSAVGIKDSDVLDMVFLPDNQSLRVASCKRGIVDHALSNPDQTTKLFKIEDVNTVTFTADGSQIAATDKAGTVYMADLKIDPEPLEFLQQEAEQAWLSPDGSRLYVSLPRSLRIWQLKPELEGKFIDKKFESGIQILAASPDGKFIAVCLGDGTAWILNTRGEFLFRLAGFEGEMGSLSFSPDGRDLLMISGGVGLMWKIGDGLFRHSRKLEQESHSLLFSLSGKELWIAEGQRLSVYQPETGDYQIKAEHASRLNALAMDPDGKWLLAGARDSSLIAFQVNGTEKFRIEGIERGKLLHMLEEKAYEATEKGKEAGEEVRKVLESIHTHTAGILSVAISPDGKRLLSASADASVRMWDLDGNCIGHIPGYKRDEISSFLTAQQSGRFTAAQQAATPDSFADAMAEGFDRPDIGGSLAGRKQPGHSRDVLHVAFAPDGTHFLSTGEDGFIGLWDLECRSVFFKEFGSRAVYCANFSPDGRHIVIGDGNGRLAIWDASGKEIWRKQQAHDAAIRNVCFSPDGRQILTASRDKRMAVWDLSGIRLYEINQHLGWLFDAVYSPDGKTIASVDADRMLRFWFTDGEAVMHKIKGSGVHQLRSWERENSGL